jgi:hypothetical protein
LHPATKGYVFDNLSSQDQIPRVEIAIQTSFDFGGENELGDDVLNRVSVATSNQEAIMAKEDQEKQEQQQQQGSQETESK